MNLKTLTRKKILQQGYYKNLNEGTANEDDYQFPKIKKKNELNRRSFIKTINYNFLRKLRTTRISSPTCNLKFPIDYRVFSFLKETLHFDSKFQENNELISKYRLKCERCENIKYYCTASNFSLKIYEGRKKEYNELLLLLIVI